MNPLTVLQPCEKCDLRHYVVFEHGGAVPYSITSFHPAQCLAAFTCQSKDIERDNKNITWTWRKTLW